jgi:two-component sensor histidine kinase
MFKTPVYSLLIGVCILKRYIFANLKLTGICAILLCSQQSRLIAEERVETPHWAGQIYLIDDTLIAYSQLLQKKMEFGEANNLDSLNWIYQNLFTYHHLYGEPDSAIYYLKQSQNLHAGSNDPKTLAATYLKLQELYIAKADYTMAMEQVFKALEIYHASNDLKNISICYSYLCELLYYENNFAEAISYCDQAILIQKELDNAEYLAATYNRKAANLMRIEGEMVNALHTINLSIAIHENAGESDIPMMVSRNIRGDIYLAMKRYDEALNDYWYNHRISMTRGLFRHAIPALSDIGQVYMLLGDYEKALLYILEAIQIMNDTGIKQNLWENFMNVSYCYEKLQQYEKALEYHKLYAIEHSNLQSAMIDRLQYGLKIKYETEKKEETIYIQAARISQQKKIQTLYISIAGLLLMIIGVMVFSIYNIRKKREALRLLNVKLDARNKQNELLMKEIHHRVKNNLEMVNSLLSLQSEQLKDSVSKDTMIACQNRIQSMGIIHQKLYQGKSLVSIDMKDYFSKLSEGILNSFNASNSVEIECNMDTIELNIDTAVPLGLIVNELMTNSLKYAFPDKRKGSIQVTMSKINPETFALAVSDDGIGKALKYSSSGSGFGYQLIALLVQQLNGIMSEENKNGTRITIEFKASEVK